MNKVKKRNFKLASLFLAAIFTFACIPGFSFPVTATETVVYVKTGGAGTMDGSSAANALSTLTSAYNAVSGGGTIVVCGVVTISSSFTAPSNTGLVTITSVYGATDYQTSGAKISLGGSYTLQGDTTFENITIHSTVDYPLIIGNYNNATYGDGITCTLESGITYYPVIVGGINATSAYSLSAASYSSDYTLTVNSGTWYYLRGGNRRSVTEAPVGLMSGDTRIIINGGTFTVGSTNTNLVTAGGMNYRSGDIYLEINGGSFTGPVYAVCRIGTIGSTTQEADELQSGNVLVKITGGTFSSTVGVSQYPDLYQQTGSYTLVVTGGTFSSALDSGGAKGECVLKYDPDELASGFEDLIEDFVLTVTIDADDDAQTSEYIDAEFSQSLMSGADPWMTQHDGVYYFCYAISGGVKVTQCGNIPLIDKVNNGRVVYTAPTGTMYSSEYWAPELHYFSEDLVGEDDAGWYIYVAADDGDNANHRMYVLKASDPENPMSDYTMLGKIYDSTNRWAIDGTVLVWNDALYFVWSGWAGTENTAQNIYIASMSDPYTISGSRVLLSSPTYSWETYGTPDVNEGPQILINGNDLFIIYSASGSWTQYYCLGMLTYDGSGSLTSVSNWVKSSTSVFSSASGAYGPGHCSFVKSTDGEENWILYRANESTTVPDGSTWWSMRTIRAQQFTWYSNGSPNFGTPIAAGTSVSIPVKNGECEATEPTCGLPGASVDISSGEITAMSATCEHIDAVTCTCGYVAPVRVTSSSVKYVSNSATGANDGSSAADAYTTVTAAFNALASTGGTIVICGNLSVTYDFSTPANSAPIKITSVYGGRDYRNSPSNAKISLSGTITMNGEIVFENINFYNTANNTMLICNQNDVTLGNGITCTLASGVAMYSSITGGKILDASDTVSEASFSGTQTLTVNSGTWTYIRGGNKRTVTDAPFGDYSGTLNVTINGGTFTNEDSTSTTLNINCAGGMNSNSGTINFVVNGGTFEGSVFAISRPGNNTTGTTPSYTGTVGMKITGGTFNGTNIDVIQNLNSAPDVTASYTLTVSGGTFAGVTTISSTKCTGTDAFYYNSGAISVGLSTGFTTTGTLTNVIFSYPSGITADEAGRVVVGTTIKNNLASLRNGEFSLFFRSSDTSATVYFVTYPGGTYTVYAYTVTGNGSGSFTVSAPVLQ